MRRMYKLYVIYFIAAVQVGVLYLRHELCNNMKALVRNDPQQSHQVLMLKLPGNETSQVNVT